MSQSFLLFENLAIAENAKALYQEEITFKGGL